MTVEIQFCSHCGVLGRDYSDDASKPVSWVNDSPVPLRVTEVVVIAPGVVTIISTLKEPVELAPGEKIEFEEWFG